METIRRELAPWLSGRYIEAALLVDAPDGPKYRNLRRSVGQRVVEVTRRGKFLVLPLSAGDELIIHLGMTGSLSPTEPPTHVRVKLKLSSGPNPALYFKDARRFGRFLVTRAGDYSLLPTLAAMGVEPLAAEFTAAAFIEALRRSRLPIKTYLLSQRPVAGIGNIYADEALWRARIDPTAPAQTLSKARAKQLRNAIRDVLTESLAAQGTTLSDYVTVNGSTGGFVQKLGVYGRHGNPCPACGTPIQKVMLGARTAHYCPRCQRR